MKNKYQIEIEKNVKAWKKDIRKIRIMRIILFLIGLILLSNTFNKEYGLYALMGGIITLSIGIRYGANKANSINKYYKQKIATIEDEEMREKLRNTK